MDNTFFLSSDWYFVNKQIDRELTVMNVHIYQITLHLLCWKESNIVKIYATMSEFSC